MFSIPGELNNCPSCKSTTVVELDYVPDSALEENGYYFSLISGCNECGHIFINPPPSQEMIDAYYAKDGGWAKKKLQITKNATVCAQAQQPVTAEPQQEEKFNRRDERNSLTPLLSLVNERFAGSEPLRVFDFGCGRGLLLNRFAQQGFHTVGLDPATHEMVTSHQMTRDMPQDQSFHLVVSKHVLEHLMDPLATLKLLKKAVRPDGFLYLGMPCLYGLEIHRMKRYVMNSTQHISGFTQSSLTAMLGKAGFRPIEFHVNEAKIQRFSCIAVVDDNAPTVTYPLSEAQAAFYAYRKSEPDWTPGYETLSVRERLAIENEKSAATIAQAEAAKKQRRQAVTSTSSPWALFKQRLGRWRKKSV